MSARCVGQPTVVAAASLGRGNCSCCQTFDQLGEPHLLAWCNKDDEGIMGLDNLVTLAFTAVDGNGRLVEHVGRNESAACADGSYAQWKLVMCS